MSFSKNLPKFTPFSRKFKHSQNNALSSSLKQKYKALELSYASYQSTKSVTDDKENETSPLVVLHGLLGSKSNFNSLCKKYQQKCLPERKIYAIDFRNHGDSWHSGEHTYDALAIDIRNFLKRMELEKVCLLGHEMGGRAGMLFALKYPELVEKLIVADISPITTSQNFYTLSDLLKKLNNIAFPRNIPLNEAKSVVTTQLASFVKSKGLMTFLMTNLVQTMDGSYCWRCNIKSLINNSRSLSFFPDFHNAIFEGPVLFVGGGKSDYIQKSDHPKIVKLFPNAKLTFIEGAGHWLHAEKPAEFLKITVDFLNRNFELT